MANYPTARPQPYYLDSVELRVRNWVRVACEISTETGAALRVIIDGRVFSIPREFLHEVRREVRRKDFIHWGSVVVPIAWAEERGIRL